MSRMLIATAEADVRRALALALRTALTPVPVVVAATWRELMVMLQSTPALLVVVDHTLIDDAAEAVQALRQAQPHARIVLMSTRPEDRRRALAAGADAFLSTVDAPAHVVNTVRRLLDLDNVGGAADAQPQV